MRILEHDDRRVDDHAYAEREAAERHGVEREAAEIEQRECADHRHRDRGADDERGAEVAQKRKDDQDDEDAADECVLLDVVDGALDEDRVVVEHHKSDAWHVAVDAGDFGADTLRDGDRVLPRLLGDLHSDGGVSLAEFAVGVKRRDALELAPILGPVLHVGDVAQIDGDSSTTSTTSATWSS